MGTGERLEPSSLAIELWERLEEVEQVDAETVRFQGPLGEDTATIILGFTEEEMAELRRELEPHIEKLYNDRRTQEQFDAAIREWVRRGGEDPLFEREP
jgi:hypothetical protein